MTSMRPLVRVVAMLAIALIAYGVLIRAFHFMNQPSDRGWYGGIAMILGLILLAPVIMREIWRLL
jgi:heme/copper-type cytochrome/quinol oxidase subunit 4